MILDVVGSNPTSRPKIFSTIHPAGDRCVGARERRPDHRREVWISAPINRKIFRSAGSSAGEPGFKLGFAARAGARLKASFRFISLDFEHLSIRNKRERTSNRLEGRRVTICLQRREFGTMRDSTRTPNTLKLIDKSRRLPQDHTQARFS